MAGKDDEVAANDDVDDGERLFLGVFDIAEHRLAPCTQSAGSRRNKCQGRHQHLRPGFQFEGDQRDLQPQSGIGGRANVGLLCVRGEQRAKARFEFQAQRAEVSVALTYVDTLQVGQNRINLRHERNKYGNRRLNIHRSRSVSESGSH